MRRITQGITRPASRFQPRDSHPLWCGFPAAWSNAWPMPHRAPTTPGPFCFLSPALSHWPDPERAGFGLFRFRSPLLTESLSLSFPPVTEMFHFTGCRDVPAMYSQELEQVLSHSGYPIRKSPGHSVFTALRGLSQLATSFIAYWHQGIHYVLFVA